MLASKGANLFIEAPDKYFAAAVMSIQGFYIGKGDRTQIIHSMMKMGTKCRAIKEKLILIQHGTFLGTKIFMDKWKDDHEDLLVGHDYIFQLWLSLVR